MAKYTVTVTDEKTPWLDEDERAAWLGLLRITALLPAALESELQRDAGLSLFEYLVMAMLSEPTAPHGTAEITRVARRRVAIAAVPRP